MLKNGLIACAAFLLLLGSSGRSAPVGDAELKASDKDASNWLMYGRTYDDHRFSPLNQRSVLHASSPQWSKYHVR